MGVPNEPDMAPGDETTPDESVAEEVTCHACGGSGEHDGEQCAHCSGSGRVVEGVGGG